MKEVWKQIEFNVNYQISNFGKIRSLPRIMYGGKNKKSSRYIKGTILMPQGRPYFHVKIGTKCYRIHQLVANYFIPNPENKPVINHKDGNKQNNHVQNLEWCTQKENAEHSVRIGLHRYGKLFGIEHGRSRPIYQYDINGKFIKKWNFLREADRTLNVSENQICRVCSTEKGSCGGSQWRYYYKLNIGKYVRKWKNRSGKGISNTLYNY